MDRDAYITDMYSGVFNKNTYNTAGELFFMVFF